MSGFRITRVQGLRLVDITRGIFLHGMVFGILGFASDIGLAWVLQKWLPLWVSFSVIGAGAIAILLIGSFYYLKFTYPHNLENILAWIEPPPSPMAVARDDSVNVEPGAPILRFARQVEILRQTIRANGGWVSMSTPAVLGQMDLLAYAIEESALAGNQDALVRYAAQIGHYAAILADNARHEAGSQGQHVEGWEERDASQGSA